MMNKNVQISRRNFTKGVLASSFGLAASGVSFQATSTEKKSENGAFTMKFAPHVNHFKNLAGNNILDQIRYAHDMGFRAWEDNRMPNRFEKEQQAIGDLLAKLGMEMGVFVAYGDFKNPIFAGNRLDHFDKRSVDKKQVKAMLTKKMEQAVEISKRCGAKWCTIVPGTIDLTLPVEYQTKNVVENLSYMAEVCEKSGLVMVLEPLNYQNHPNCFLTRISQAYEICKMVDSASCKILDDLYHQQITEGNLIQNMADAWDEIAYIQIGDVPGRKEPGTGEINYNNIMTWLHKQGYNGIIGAEHGIKNKGVDGEKDLIQAYRSIDVTIKTHG
ncbi:hydroxypyruvate isomerase family protein [Catenovulum adriaticum]|uniref:TIM barrel protein n=1 Tax=Catenovulum adriaticum TaxID=2984846 RepID=A0ABY7AQK3_9ALTE|nr:TIM barrel protein [Catenovulum sp. TS8]WAJ71827.1 TIM barrel protein [Catenovulum sp. TS8]